MIDIAAREALFSDTAGFIGRHLVPCDVTAVLGDADEKDASSLTSLTKPSPSESHS